MKQISIALKTMAIKAKLANLVRRTFNEYVEPNVYNRYKKEILTDTKK